MARKGRARARPRRPAPRRLAPGAPLREFLAEAFLLLRLVLERIEQAFVEWALGPLAAARPEAGVVRFLALSGLAILVLGLAVTFRSIAWVRELALSLVAALLILLGLLLAWSSIRIHRKAASRRRRIQAWIDRSPQERHRELRRWVADRARGRSTGRARRRPRRTARA